VDDVLRGEAATGAIESTIATGPSTGISSFRPTSSASSRCSARTRLSPEFTPPPAAASTPPVLLVPAEQDPPAPAQDRRHADARLGAHQASAGLDDPNPRTPRSVAAARPPRPSRRPQRHDDELGDPHSGLDDERPCRSVFSRITRTSPR
jgi:hypothetical protein